MVKLGKGKKAYAPSGALGIMRFFDADTKAPQIRPELLIIIIVAILIVTLIMNYIVLK
ncbi:MAG: preprotein translocase subunit Sec61beta [Candidatus Diapherotrites archaeon]|nr:preprotein translocase subunit Sec61beta [Candidatus Diapherotrites archaeon]